MESLGEAVFLPTMLAAGFSNALANGRAAAANERAIDAQEAASISSDAMYAFADSATRWRTEAVLAGAEIRRQREVIDDLVLERSDLIAAIDDLMKENDRLLARAR
jgi:hypothetical protein